jgi:23S rRNA maturation mini-RNase III
VEDVILDLRNSLHKLSSSKERMQKIVSRVVRRMLNQAQAGALERWCTNVSELARQRDIMDRILRRMLNAKMAAGQTRPMLACLLRVLLIFVSVRLESLRFACAC